MARRALLLPRHLALVQALLAARQLRLAVVGIARGTRSLGTPAACACPRALNRPTSELANNAPNHHERENIQPSRLCRSQRLTTLDTAARTINNASSGSQGARERHAKMLCHMQPINIKRRVFSHARHSKHLTTSITTTQDMISLNISECSLLDIASCTATTNFKCRHHVARTNAHNHELVGVPFQARRILPLTVTIKAVNASLTDIDISVSHYRYRQSALTRFADLATQLKARLLVAFCSRPPRSHRASQFTTT